MTARKSASRPAAPASTEATADELTQAAQAADLQRQIEDLVSGNAMKRPPRTLREFADRPEILRAPDETKPATRSRKKSAPPS